MISIGKMNIIRSGWLLFSIKWVLMQRYNNGGIEKILFLTNEYETNERTYLTCPKLMSIE